jgi:hypothetical protein
MESLLIRRLDGRGHSATGGTPRPKCVALRRLRGTGPAKMPCTAGVTPVGSAERREG